MSRSAPADESQPTSRPSTARWFVALFLTLRGRLILLVCFATVPAILFIFFVAAGEREAALERMETEARHLGSLASREHAHQINGGRSLLRRLGAVIALGTEPTCPDYLPALLSGFQQFANIGVATPTGEVVCSAAPIQQPANLTENAAFTRALQSDDVEAGTYVIGFIRRPVLHLAYAMRGPTGLPSAVLFVAVELGWLDQLARQANLPADYSLLITDRTGRVLTRSGAVAQLDQRGSEAPALARVLDRPQGAVLEAGSPAVARYFVATPMQGVPGIFVVAALPYERLEEAANRAFYRTLIGLVLVTIFAIAAAILAAEFSVLRVLRSLTRTVRRFGAGDLSARPPLPGSHGELRELAISFGSMADALAARQREASDAQDRLRALSHRVQAARDEEAGRIARELHDELGQMLTGLKMELASLRRSYAGSAHAAAADPAIARMSEQIDGAIDSVRRISSELRPAVLDRLGLAAAMDWLVHEIESKSGLSIVFHADDLREPVDALVSTTVFRIAQEALTNVIRHARATEVVIDLVGRETTLALTIHDDGIGIDPAAIEGPSSLGILGMRERARLLGGTWRVHGAQGKGTTIEVEVPRAPRRALDSFDGTEQP
ncbi:MAG: HAMP domain-containing protein [Sandaracinaceae bacterium]|nr:HAMP domain-containing protein [Sandaracinaceae bacterium]